MLLITKTPLLRSRVVSQSTEGIFSCGFINFRTLCNILEGIF